jgi:methylenetetrahydrofolate dehydrogenase (NADP+) / methenyltetrahydrofolate cyclohydrolase
MTAQIINGKEIAKETQSKIALEVSELKKQFKVIPTLAVILVGNDPASEVYVRNKEKTAHLVGMNSIQFKMSDDISEEELISKIEELNNDKKIHGILVQLPIPKHIDAKKVINAIDYEKDVDGFNIINVGKLATGQVGDVDGALVPCTPLGCVDLLKSVKGDNLAGLKILVIGNSNIVGRPLAQLLLIERATVTVANSSTKDLKSECLASDVIISAAGVVNLVKADMVKKDAVIIDVGINRISLENGKTRLVGDVDFENVKEVASAITPVPGGVGPMTITYLLKNTLNCYLKTIKK